MDALARPGRIRHPSYQVEGLVRDNRVEVRVLFGAWRSLQTRACADPVASPLAALEGRDIVCDIACLGAWLVFVEPPGSRPGQRIRATRRHGPSDASRMLDRRP